jgi:hypothetical protein
MIEYRASSSNRSAAAVQSEAAAELPASPWMTLLAVAVPALAARAQGGGPYAAGRYGRDRLLCPDRESRGSVQRESGGHEGKTEESGG